MSDSQLENMVLAAFRRAEAEGRRDAAEHLMRALETLCPCPDDAALCGSALAEAYGDLAREKPPAACSGADDPCRRGSTRNGGKGHGTTGTSVRSVGRRR